MMTDTTQEPSSDQRPTVIGVGELLFDCFYDDGRPEPGKAPAHRRAGGAPANVAIHADQLGCRGIVCSKVGDDSEGEALLAHLRSEGIEIDGVQQAPNAPTSTVDVDTSDPTHPSYVIHTNVAWDHLEFSDAWHTLFREASAICFGTLALRSGASRAAIFRGLATAKPDALRIYDINIRPPHFELDWIRSALERCNVLKLNRDELAMLRRMLSSQPAPAMGVPEVQPSGAAADGHSVDDVGGSGDESDFEYVPDLMQRFQIRIVCITKGSEGCTIFSDDGRVDIAGREINVVDAVGAGDAFTAGLIFGLLHGWPVEAAGGLANEVGALVASRPGATPSLRENYRELVAQYRPPRSEA